MRVLRLGVMLAAGFLAIAPASAAPKFLGKSGTWRAYSNSNEHGLFCYAVGQPSAMAASTGRARTYLMISDQPARNVVEEPQIISGYPALDGNTASLHVGGKSFDFFFQGGDGWLAQLSENDRLMQALRSSRSAVITGAGPDGVMIRDSYNLTGLTQAMAKARTACWKLVAGRPFTVSHLFR